jgi:hypothetical protein
MNAEIMLQAKLIKLINTNKQECYKRGQLHSKIRFEVVLGKKKKINKNQFVT